MSKKRRRTQVQPNFVIIDGAAESFDLRMFYVAASLNSMLVAHTGCKRGPTPSWDQVLIFPLPLHGKIMRDAVPLKLELVRLGFQDPGSSGGHTVVGRVRVELPPILSKAFSHTVALVGSPPMGGFMGVMMDVDLLLRPPRYLRYINDINYEVEEEQDY